MSVLCAACGFENKGEAEYCIRCAAAVKGSSRENNRSPSRTSDGRSGMLRNVLGIMPSTLADRIRTAAPSIVGERREVTVLSIVLESHGAGGSTDLEDVYLSVNEIIRQLAEIIYLYEGHVDKLTEDNLIALFGAPITHENDPERAVRAAASIRAKLLAWQQRIKTDRGVIVQLSFGIHTGNVMLGHVGDNLQMEYTIVGDTIRLASQLAEEAEFGAILVSGNTYQRTRPIFRYRPIPGLEIHGKEEPVQAFQLVKVRKKPGRLRGLPDLHVAMVGRQEYLEQLAQNAEAVVREGKARAVLISGEAGLGKSRLMMEFRRYLAKRGRPLSFYLGNCLSYARSRPYWLVSDLIRDIVGLTDDYNEATRIKELRGYLLEIGLGEETTTPYLADLLGLTSSNSDIKDRLRQFDADMLQKLTYDSVRQLLLHEAKLAPIILVLEDLHWLDDASWGAVQHLLQTLVDAPILFLLVTRDDSNRLSEITDHVTNHLDGLAHIELTGLTRNESEELVDRLITGTTRSTSLLKKWIVERAAGNPFYTEEIIRMLAEEGGLTWKDDGYQATSRARSVADNVPATLQGLIMTRTDSLGKMARQTLQEAAVLGSVFQAEVIIKLNSESPGVVREHLNELVDRRFLVADASERREFAFRHSLIRDTIYSSLLSRHRRRLHDAAALVIDGFPFFTISERAEIMAHHLANGNEPATAVPFLLVAAQNAADRFANKAALQYYQQVLDLMNGVSQEDVLSIQAKVGKGRALKLMGQYEEANQILSEVADLFYVNEEGVVQSDTLEPMLQGLRELADVQQREGAYGEAASHLEAGLRSLDQFYGDQEVSLYRSMVERLAFVRFRQGQLDDAFALANKAAAETSIEAWEDPAIAASLFNTLGGISWQLGNIEDALYYVKQSLQIYQNLSYSWGIAQACSNLGVLNAQMGEWNQTINYWEQAVRLRSETGDVLGQATDMSNLGQLRLMMGDHKGARKNLEQSLHDFQRLGDDWGAVQVLANLALLDLVEHRLDEADANITNAMTLAKEVEGQSVQVNVRWVLALIQAENSDLQAGIDTAKNALQMARDAGQMEGEAECLRVLGMLSSRIGAYVEAETLFKQSEELCRQIRDPYRQGLALMELGRLYKLIARVRISTKMEWLNRGYDSLQRAEELLTRLGAAYDLQIVQILLEEVESSIAAGRVVTDRLIADRALLRHRTEGERHTATVLWMDLILPPDADEEIVFENVAFLLPACATIGQEKGGFVRQRTDGLSIIFGAPTTHEDDPERAVEAAYEIARNLQRENGPAELPVQFRIGLSHGQVLAGRIGQPVHSEFVVQGVPLQEARQIAALSGTGRILVASRVRQETERIGYYRPAVASDANVVEAWELIGIRERPAPARGIPSLSTRFIGREPAIKEMIRLSENLKRGIGGIIWIEGEAGIGKSRLMREFQVEFPDHDKIIWHGGCSAQRSQVAFGLFSDLISQVFDLQPGDDSVQIQDKITASMTNWPEITRASRPYLELLAGIEPGGVEGRRLASLEPDQIRQQIFVTFRRLLKTLAGREPMVLFMDDLHWVDPMSAELLLFVATIVASEPILFVCAQRREGADSPNDRLVRLQSLLPGQTIRLFLDRLSEVESETLVRELLSGSDLPGELFNSVASSSEGNPYFIEEFVRMFIERGYLHSVNGRWQLDQSRPVGEIPVPSSLEALIRSRVDSLPPELKQTLQCAAVIGRRFQTHLVQELVERPNVGFALERLAARLMLRPGDGSDSWEFSHYLFESVVYNSMLRAHRKELHLRLADALEKWWAGFEADHAEELAHHFQLGGDSERALPYMVLAGERAVSRNANEEALVYFQQAASILHDHHMADEEVRWRIAVGLGDVYRFVGKYVESIGVLRTGLPLAETGRLFNPQRAGLYRRLAETAQKQGEYERAQEYYSRTQALLGQPDDPELQLEAARTLVGLAWVHFAQGQFEQALAVCKECMNYAAKADGLAELAAAENLLGGIYYHLGEWRTALQHTTRAMVLREQLGYSWGVAATLSNLGILSFSAGQWSKALNFFQRSLDLRKEMGDVEGMAITTNNLGMVHREQGDLALAKTYFKESLDTAELFEIAYHVANAHGGLASVYYHQGDIRAARKTIEAAIMKADDLGARDLLAEMNRWHAEILLAHSDCNGAHESALKAAELATELGNRGYESAGWRVAAEVSRREGDYDEALGYLAKSQSALEEVKDNLEAGRVALQASRIYEDVDRMDEAREETSNRQSAINTVGR